MPGTDKAHRWTDERIEQIRRYLVRLYGKAAKEMGAALDDLMLKHMAEYLDELQDRTSVPKPYDRHDPATVERDRWLSSQASRFAAAGGATVLPQLVEIGLKADSEREAVVHVIVQEVYQRNYSYSIQAIAESAERLRLGISFGLVNEDAVALLLDPQLKLLPGRKAAALNERWWRQRLQSRVLSGILRGESIPNMAAGLQEVCGMQEAAAVRAARTACTHAENAGRMKSYERAQAMGILLEKKWIATDDDRTRDSHRELDGETREIHEPFSNGLMEPGDPTGEPSEVWNCRCSMGAVVYGFDA